MQVGEVMTPTVVTVGPAHTLRQVARAMAERRVGAAVVHDPDADGPGIVTERDILEAVAKGEDPDSEPAAEHLTREAVIAQPGWSLLQAAETMLRGGFRHLVVCDGPDVVGVLSVRDVLRAWTQERLGEPG